MRQYEKEAPMNQTLREKIRTHKIVWIVGTLLTLYIVSLFLPFVSAYTRYHLYVVKCGGLPIEASSFAAGYSYTIPGSRGYRVDIFSNHYFCTEQEAQAAGYHKSPTND